MSRSLVGVVFARELREILRDRRTLFATFVLPVVLYPALLLGFGSAARAERESMARRAFAVAVTRDGRPAAGPAGDAADDPLFSALTASGRFTFLTEDPADDDPVRAGRAALRVDVPSDLAARIARRELVALRPAYRSHDPESKAALEAFRDAVRATRDRFAPLSCEAEDLSDARERGGAAFGGVIAFVVTVMALLGAFAPAVDLVAGEKERGTLEALLTTPATRRQLVLGKYAAVLACGVAASVSNLASLGLTFLGLRGMMPAGVGAAEVSVALDAAGFGVVLLALVALSALFGAVALALSALARTYKEGLAYLSPLYMVVLPLAMAPLLPSARLDDLLFAPVANVALLVKESLSGRPVGGAAWAACASLLVSAVAALEFTTALFRREDVLFRDGRAQFVLFRRRGAERAAAPTPGLALFALLVVAALTLHVAAPVGLRGGPLAGLAAQFAVFAAVPLLLAAAAQLRVREVFGFRGARARAWLGTPLVAAGGAVVAFLAATLVDAGRATASGEGVLEVLKPLLARGVVTALAAVALFPAVAEEILFRGFLLAGLRSAFGATTAVVASAAVFAAAHLDLGRLPSTFVLGLVLGVLRVRTGSTGPGMLAHFLVNATVVGLAVASGDGGGGAATGDLAGLETGTRIAVCAGLAVAGYGLLRGGFAVVGRDPRSDLGAAEPAR